MLVFLSSFIRRKNFYIYFSLITICITFLIIIINIYNKTSFSILERENNIINRELVISTYDDLETVKKKLESIKSIKKIYKFIHPIDAKLIVDEPINIQITSGTLEHFPKVLAGYNIKEEDKNNIILPSKMYIQNKLILGETLLNRQIAFSINIDDKVIQYTGKVVGIYESQNDSENFAYISYNDMYNILYSDNDNDKNLNTYSIIIDRQENVNKAIDNINKHGYNASLYNNVLQKETNMLKILKNIITLMIVSLIFSLYIILHAIINNMLNEEKKEIAILKSIGYNNIRIFLISLFRTMFLIIVSFILSIFLSNIVIKIVNFMFFNEITNEINTNKIYFNHLIVSFFLILFVSFLATISSIKRIKKLAPILIFRLD